MFRYYSGMMPPRDSTELRWAPGNSSTAAVLGLGAALPSPSAPAVLQRRAVAFRIRVASSSQPGRSAWRAGSRAFRGERLQAAAAGRHASLRVNFLQDVENGPIFGGMTRPSTLTSTLATKERGC